MVGNVILPTFSKLLMKKKKKKKHSFAKKIVQLILQISLW